MDPVRRAELIDQILASRPDINNYAKRLLHNDHNPAYAAEEITQDVLMKSIRRAEDFRNISKLSTWLYRITFNETMSYLRVEKRRKTQMMDQLETVYNDESGAQWNFDREELFMNHTEKRYINMIRNKRLLVEIGRRVSRFKPLDQKIFRLRTEGFNHREIAAMAGIPKGTVKSRLYRMLNSILPAVTR